MTTPDLQEISEDHEVKKAIQGSKIAPGKKGGAGGPSSNRNATKRVGGKTGKANTLACAFPEIAAQWHPTRNGNLTPMDVTPKAGRTVWWKCEKSEEHEWQARIDNRTRRSQPCPYCGRAGRYRRALPSAVNANSSFHSFNGKQDVKVDDGTRKRTGSQDTLKGALGMLELTGAPMSGGPNPPAPGAWEGAQGMPGQQGPPGVQGQGQYPPLGWQAPAPGYGQDIQSYAQEMQQQQHMQAVQQQQQQQQQSMAIPQAQDYPGHQQQMAEYRHQHQYADYQQQQQQQPRFGEYPMQQQQQLPPPPQQQPQQMQMQQMQQAVPSLAKYDPAEMFKNAPRFTPLRGMRQSATAPHILERHTHQQSSFQKAHYTQQQQPMEPFHGSYHDMEQYDLQMQQHAGTKRMRAKTDWSMTDAPNVQSIPEHLVKSSPMSSDHMTGSFALRSTASSQSNVLSSMPSMMEPTGSFSSMGAGSAAGARFDPGPPRGMLPNLSDSSVATSNGIVESHAMSNYASPDVSMMNQGVQQLPPAHIVHQQYPQPQQQQQQPVQPHGHTAMNPNLYQPHQGHQQQQVQQNMMQFNADMMTYQSEQVLRPAKRRMKHSQSDSAVGRKLSPAGNDVHRLLTPNATQQSVVRKSSDM